MLDTKTAKTAKTAKMTTRESAFWHQRGRGPRWIADDRVAITVWAPHGERLWVELEGGERIELVRDGERGELWRAELAPVAPGDRYRVVLRSTHNDCYDREGEQLSRRDPWAREADFDSDWCALADPSFDWTPIERPLPPPEQWVIYELHVGSFAPPAGGSGQSAFARAASRLEHVAELGCNAVQLMPVTEFGGIWGYNPRQLLAVHGPWGSAQELRQLIDRAHQLGLAVIVDIVLNHGSVKRNCLWNWDGYGPDGNGGIYFEGERDTPWGRRFAFHKEEVARYLEATCRMWIDEYRVDGLRFDSVHNMPWELSRRLTWALRQDYPEVFLIAEVTPEDPAVINDAGYDACWIHAAHFDARKVQRRRDGAESGEGRLGLLRSLIEMHPGFPRSASGVNSLLGSHDQCGDRHDGRDEGGSHRYFVSRLGGRDNWHARAQLRMWAALQAFSRGLPMIFMGTETLQDGWWHVDDAHRFDWGLVDGGDRFTIETLRCLRDMHTLRRERPALTGERLRFVHGDPHDTVLGWVRWTEDEDREALLCVANLSERQWERGDYLLQTGWGPGERWGCVFNSQAEAYGGWAGSGPVGELESDDEGRLPLTLPKWSVLAFTQRVDR